MRTFKIKSIFARVIVIMSFFLTNISLFAQENIASKATITTSYVSTWESYVVL